jgi:hypothetical protein
VAINSRVAKSNREAKRAQARASAGARRDKLKSLKEMQRRNFYAREISSVSPHGALSACDRKLSENGQ